MRAFGAEVELIPGPDGITPGLIPSMMRRAAGIAAQTGAFATDQFSNADMIEGWATGGSAGNCSVSFQGRSAGRSAGRRFPGRRRSARSAAMSAPRAASSVSAARWPPRCPGSTGPLSSPPNRPCCRASRQGPTTKELAALQRA
jgi:hypothetical protein